MLLANAAWQNDSVPGLLGLLERQPAELRGFEWNYLWRLAHQDRYTLRIRGSGAQPSAADPPRASFMSMSPALVALSPDGKMLATAGEAEPIKLWDLASGKEVQTLAAPGGPVAALAFAPGGKELWAVAIKEQVKGPASKKEAVQAIMTRTLKAMMSGTEKPSLKPLLEVLAVHSLPVSGGAVTTAEPDAAHLKTPFNSFAAGQKSLPVLLSAIIPLPGGRIFSPMVMTASPDGKHLALGGLVTNTPTPTKPKLEQFGAILLWDVDGGREQAVLTVQGSPVITLAFSPDGKMLASSDFGKAITLWDVATGREQATLRGHTAPVLSCAFSADGKHVASGAIDGIIKVWELSPGQLELTCRGHVQPVISLAWAPDGRTLVSGSMDRLVKVWDLATVKSAPTAKGFEGAVNALAFSGDGTTLAAVDQKGTLVVCDGASGEIRSRHHLNLALGLSTCAVFSPDLRSVATGGPMPDVVLFDVATGARRVSLPGHAGVVYSLAFAPGGKILAVGTGEAQKSGVIKLWDANMGKELRALGGYKNHVLSVAWSPDRKVLAGGAKDGTVKVWDGATGQERLSFHAGPTMENAPGAGLFQLAGGVKAVAFSPDGRALAVASGSIITLHDTKTGKILVTMNGFSHEPDSLAFSPDGRRLASGGGEGQFDRGGGTKLWDTATGLEVLSLGDPSDVVRCIAFSPDSGRLATSAMDGSGVLFLSHAAAHVTIWDGHRLP
jgi:WD40 repeat protein